MTQDELRKFAKMFTQYCRHEMAKGNCTGDTCEWCPINTAYNEVKSRAGLETSINVHIYDIWWDTDGKRADLPTEIDRKFDGYDNITDEDLQDEIADWLSNEYGYCHYGFMVRQNRDEI